LVVIADDYGIGPETSRGILELAQRQLVTGTVLLVNSPYVEPALKNWRQAGQPMEMGWHPNLTLDAPILPARQVPSLVAPDGNFWPLGKFLSRLYLGRINADEVSAEFEAQFRRYIDLVGKAPTHINSHQHVGIFGTVRDCLLNLLLREGVHPYVRRVREPWSMIWQTRGARKKRVFLNHFGRITSRDLDQYGFPGSEWLAGITDPPWVRQGDFFENWLRAIPGQVVELSCHPGHLDTTLLGRDCVAGDNLMERRADEFVLMSRPELPRAIQEAGFTLAAPSQLSEEPLRHAA